MKTTSIISALVFAHVAFAQATDSTSAAASNSASKASAEPTKSSTKSNAAGTSTSEPAATGSSFPISQSQTSNSGNPLIPSAASDACTTFLNQLNTDTSLSSCFTPLLNALSAFTSSGSGSASSVSKTLNTLCASNACSASTMRAKLTDFKDACSDELTGANPNDIIIKNYDVFYSLIPFKQAVCTKDTDTQAYCLLNIGSGSSSSNATSNLAARNPHSLAYAANHLTNSVSRKRAQTVLVPNTDTYRNTNLMYLFTSPDMNAGELCVSCTQQILSKYVAFESSTPYALGLKNSPLLGGQSELWAAVQEKCPTSFLTEVSNIAGVASADDINAASPAMAGSLFTALAGALAAALALF